MGRDVRNHKMPWGNQSEAQADKLLPICGHCLPSSAPHCADIPIISVPEDSDLCSCM